jgi:branched-chain amino acid aminotransferase
MEIKRTLLPAEKLKPLYDNALKLKFGVNFTDYMFTMSCNQEQGWHSAEIKPYQPLMLEPAASVFHYGQEVFEGQKAYKSKRGEILLFRPQENAKRYNASSRRLSMPEIPVEDYLYYVDELVKLEERWIPTQKGASLYIRPTGIATEPALGVKASKDYLFFVITCPVGPYYSTGFDPVSLCVCKLYARAGSGGTGDAKAGGNYGASHIATRDAIARGYNQVLWLDGCERRYVEEVGAMNIFFIIDDQLVTPPLTGTILPGITRRSLLELGPDLGIESAERLVSIDELVEGIESGRVTEIFGAGTAAIISPVGKINYNEKEYIINNNRTGPWAQKLFDTLTGIQSGEIEDKFGWVHVVK